MAKRRATIRATTSGKKPRMTTSVKTPSVNPTVVDDSSDDLVKVAKNLTATLERFAENVDNKESHETAFEAFVEHHMELSKKKMEAISAEIIAQAEKKLQERPPNTTVSTQTGMPPADENPQTPLSPPKLKCYQRMR